VAEIPQQPVARERQSAGAAHDRHSLPRTVAAAPWDRDSCTVELEVAGDGDVQLSIEVVVDERAPGLPSHTRQSDSRGFREVAKGAVPFIAIEHAPAVLRYEQVAMGIVVVVANA